MVLEVILVVLGVVLVVLGGVRLSFLINSFLIKSRSWVGYKQFPKIFKRLV